MTEQEKNSTYAEALKAAGRARMMTLIPEIQIHPELVADRFVQTKFATVVTAMMSVGRMPGDLPPSEFDEAMHYHYLPEKSLEWLEERGIPVRRDFAPLGAPNYAWLFGHPARLLVSEKDAGLFFSRFIHALLIETQIILAKQYYQILPRK